MLLFIYFIIFALESNKNVQQLKYRSDYLNLKGGLNLRRISSVVFFFFEKYISLIIFLSLN